MLPNFVVPETIVRESGESAAFEIDLNAPRITVLTFSITHSVERQHIHLSVYGSEDGKTWASRPLVSFPPKCYCGDYQMTLPPGGCRYIKAAWRLNRWARPDSRPFFRFYLYADLLRARAALAGAA